MRFVARSIGAGDLQSYAACTTPAHDKHEVAYCHAVLHWLFMSVLRSAGAAIAIDAVMKVASTNCASINELAQLGTFNTRAHGPWVSRFCATRAHVPPSTSVLHLGLQPNIVKKG